MHIHTIREADLCLNCALIIGRMILLLFITGVIAAFMHILIHLTSGILSISSSLKGFLMPSFHTDLSINLISCKMLFQLLFYSYYNPNSNEAETLCKT